MRPTEHELSLSGTNKSRGHLETPARHSQWSARGALDAPYPIAPILDCLVAPWAAPEQVASPAVPSVERVIAALVQMLVPPAGLIHQAVVARAAPDNVFAAEAVRTVGAAWGADDA